MGNHAVSEVIATLLLIAIAISAAVLVYVFSISLLGNLGSIGGQQISEQLMLEAYSWSQGFISGSFRNVGSSMIALGPADVFVNGIFAGHPGGGCVGVTLAPQQSCSFIISPNGGCETGMAYSLKVVTPAGGIFTYPITCGATQ